MTEPDTQSIRARLEARPDAIRCVRHQTEYEARLRQLGGSSARRL